MKRVFFFCVFLPLVVWTGNLPFSPVETAILQDFCQAFGSSLPPVSRFIDCQNVSNVCDRAPLASIICSTPGTSIEQLTIDGEGMQYFNGSLPDSFGNFYTLRFLSIKNTGIRNLPATIARMNVLLTLQLTDNPLMSGPFPDVSNMTYLNTLVSRRNGFQGPLPASVLSSALLVLFENNTQLDGTLPDVTIAAPRVQLLSLTGNAFTGNVPNVNGLNKLTALNLDNNALTGTIPAALNLPFVSSFSAAGNRLTGPLPDDWVSNFPRLLRLNLAQNQITGDFPASLGQHPALNEIHVEGNDMSGHLPSLSGSTNMTVLLLAGNQFCGCFPDKAYFSQHSLYCTIAYSTFCCSDPAPRQCADAWLCLTNNCSCSMTCNYVDGLAAPTFAPMPLSSGGMTPSAGNASLTPGNTSAAGDPPSVLTTGVLVLCLGLFCRIHFGG